MEATVPLVFSGDETTDLGRDTGTGVTPDYATGDNSFNGRIHWVQIDVDENAEPRPSHHPERGVAMHANCRSGGVPGPPPRCTSQRAPEQRMQRISPDR